MASGGALTLIPRDGATASDLHDRLESAVSQILPDDDAATVIASDVDEREDCVVVREHTLDTESMRPLFGILCNEHPDLLAGWGRVGGEDMDGTTNVAMLAVERETGEVTTVNRFGEPKLPSACGEFTFRSTTLAKPEL